VVTDGRSDSTAARARSDRLGLWAWCRHWPRGEPCSRRKGRWVCLRPHLAQMYSIEAAAATTVWTTTGSSEVALTLSHHWARSSWPRNSAECAKY